MPIRKRHGLDRPFHILQVTGWLASAFNIAVSYTVISACLTADAKICFLVLFTFSEALVLCFGVAATVNDPTDPAIKVQEQIVAAGGVVEQDGYEAQCGNCNMFVHISSKHCGQCDRCVRGFDHHCKWLNNCVGGSNYRLFIGLITSLMVNVCILFSFSVIALYCYYSDNDRVNDDIESQLGGSAEGWSVVIWVVAFLSLSIAAATGNLISLHIYLKCRGITTFQLIQENRSKKVVSVLQTTPDSPPSKGKVHVQIAEFKSEPIAIESRLNSVSTNLTRLNSKAEPGSIS